MLGNQNEHPSYHLPAVVIATIHFGDITRGRFSDLKQATEAKEGLFTFLRSSVTVKS